MVNGIREVFTYELKRNAVRKGYLFATFGIPILLFVVMFGYNLISSASQPSAEDLAKQFDFQGIETAGYVDLSGEFPVVPETLAKVLFAYPDEAAARTALQSGE